MLAILVLRTATNVPYMRFDMASLTALNKEYVLPVACTTP
jgi:hypothetical protein